MGTAPATHAPLMIDPMPKVSPAIPDSLILKHLSDRVELSDEIPLLPQQVAMLLGRSKDQMQEDRKVGKPPPHFKIGGDHGPVRYRLGGVRDFIFSHSEKVSTSTPARPRGSVKASSFSDFIRKGGLEDKWPFTFEATKGKDILIEFFESLARVSELSDEAECMLLSLEEMLNKRISIEQRAKEKDKVDKARRSAEKTLLEARGGDAFAPPKARARH
jgi:hypothetical protein